MSHLSTRHRPLSFRVPSQHSPLSNSPAVFCMRTICTSKNPKGVPLQTYERHGKLHCNTKFSNGTLTVGTGHNISPKACLTQKVCFKKLVHSNFTHRAFTLTNFCFIFLLTNTYHMPKPESCVRLLYSSEIQQAAAIDVYLSTRPCKYGKRPHGTFIIFPRAALVSCRCKFINLCFVRSRLLSKPKPCANR